MKNKIIIIMKENIDDYPPILSLINIAKENGKEVFLIAGCKSDSKFEELEKQGVQFTRLEIYRGNFFKRLMLLINLKKIALNLVSSVYDENTIVWIVQSEIVALLGKKVWKYDTVGHFLEIRNPELSIGYKMLSFGCDYKKSIRNLNKVICCEYNRAHITKWMFSLKETPVILPNKPFWDDSSIVDNEYTLNLKKRYSNKKIILYQGIIDTERHLEAFIDAVNQLSDDFVMFIMGGKSEYSEHLKKEYASNKIVFLDFITPPIHLCVTRMCHIGILAYTPDREDIGIVLNVLYCAPNKLYEYSKFGKPMICNENPALKSAFLEYNAGESINIEDVNSIINSINLINENYNSYQAESYKLYESVDVGDIVSSIIDQF